MAVEVMVPRLGWSMESGVFGQWLKQDGDAVAAGDPIFSVEGEKATEEVESEDAGILRIRPGVATPGAELTVGTVIGWLLAEGEAVPEVTAEPAPQPGAAPGAVPPAGPPPVAVTAAATVTAAVPGGRRLDGQPASSPRARRVARELGVDWRLASGSGRGGRIRERDVRALAGRPAESGAPAVAAPLPDLSAWGPVETVPLSPARLRTVERRSQTCRNVPMVTQHATADVTRLEALRARYAPRAEAAGGTLTLTAMLAKVAASALKVFPQFNASVDVAAGALVRRGYRHVGIAVDDGAHGLAFPVIRDADRKNMLQLAAEIDDLRARVGTGTLDPAATQGGCFSICDLGFLGLAGRGAGHFTPLVNAPEAAILGVSPLDVSPSNREPAPGGSGFASRLPLSLTCDHRVIDWPDAVRFLSWLVEALEEPLLLSLEG